MRQGHKKESEERSRGMVTYCTECYSKKVHVTAWIDPNTDEVLPIEPPLEGGYCIKCDKEVETGITELAPKDFVLVAKDGGPAYGWYKIVGYDENQSIDCKEIWWDAVRLVDSLKQTLHEADVTPEWETDCPPRCNR